MCMSHCIPQNIKKTCTQELKFGKINKFYCFILNILEWSWYFFPFTISTWEWIKYNDYSSCLILSPRFMLKYQQYYPVILYHQCKCATQLFQYHRCDSKKFFSALTISASLVFVGKHSHKRRYSFIGADTRWIEAKQQVQPHFLIYPFVRQVQFWRWVINSVFMLATKCLIQRIILSLLVNVTPVIYLLNFQAFSVSGLSISLSPNVWVFPVGSTETSTRDASVTSFLVWKSWNNFWLWKSPSHLCLKYLY